MGARKALYILGQLRDEDVEWMIESGRRLPVETGTELIRQGHPIDGLYLILGGEFAVVNVAAGGQELARLRVGEVLGEISFVDQAPPSATVRATANSIVLEIPRATLRTKIEQDREFAARFYFAVALFLSDRLRATVGLLGYGPPQASSERDEDELDPEVLDAVHLAGDRFKRILERLLEAGE